MLCSSPCFGTRQTVHVLSGQRNMCLTPGRARKEAFEIRGEGIWAWTVSPFCGGKARSLVLCLLRSGEFLARIPGILVSLQEQVQIIGLVWSTERLRLTTASGSSWAEWPWLKTSLKNHTDVIHVYGPARKQIIAGNQSPRLVVPHTRGEFPLHW